MTLWELRCDLGRGTFGIGGIDQAALCSGQVYKDVLYLDVLSDRSL